MLSHKKSAGTVNIDISNGMSKIFLQVRHIKCACGVFSVESYLVDPDDMLISFIRPFSASNFTLLNTVVRDSVGLF